MCRGVLMRNKEGLKEDIQQIREQVRGSKDNEEAEEVELQEEGSEPEEDYYYEEEGGDYKEYEEDEELEEEEEFLEEDLDDEEYEEEIDEEYEEDYGDYGEEPQEEEPEKKEEVYEEDRGKDMLEPPKNKEIKVPDIEAGPLFIRVEKFKKVKRKVREMEETCDSLRTKMSGLESTLKEDRDINKDVDKLLKDLEDFKDAISTRISPDQK